MRRLTAAAGALATGLTVMIGGNLLTVNDDVHAGALAVPDCAARIIGYFDTGTPGTDQCP